MQGRAGDRQSTRSKNRNMYHTMQGGRPPTTHGSSSEPSIFPAGWQARTPPMARTLVFSSNSYLKYLNLSSGCCMAPNHHVSLSDSSQDHVTRVLARFCNINANFHNFCNLLLLHFA